MKKAFIKTGHYNIEIDFLDTKYDLPQTIRFGDGNFVPQTILDQSMFQRVGDPFRVLKPIPPFDHPSSFLRIVILFILTTRSSVLATSNSLTG